MILQNYCRKLDTGLFVVASNTKKRPNNLVFGRVFDSQVLDMLELGVTNYKPMKDFRHPGGIVGAKVSAFCDVFCKLMCLGGMKPAHLQANHPPIQGIYK